MITEISAAIGHQMMHYLINHAFDVSVQQGSPALLEYLERAVSQHLGPNGSPIRFVVTASQPDRWQCEVGVLEGGAVADNIFRFEKRTREDAGNFNVAMLVPTGIGAEIGGHAGDATPAATLLASVCDTLITHPNVLNASDLIQIPQNTLYVEGSVISRVLTGTVGLSKTRANRVLVVIQHHQDELFTSMAYNATNAARATYGLNVTDVVELDQNFRMVAEHTSSGSSAGKVYQLDSLWDILDRYQGQYDAVAINSVIEVAPHFHKDYYAQRGDMVNPWGGVEAILTHAVSLKYGVPAAHSPMLESRDVAEIDLGIVDSRMAAEAISLTYFQSVLRGLQHSPRITVGSEGNLGSTLNVGDIDCLVIPDGCLGIPTMAALQQGITVIAVEENRNVMRNDLASLPWGRGQYIPVENYWEAAGLLAALRAGLDPTSVRRPYKDIEPTSVAPPIAALPLP